MWIVPTYLGKPDPNARAHIYFLWGQYDSDFEASQRLEDFLHRAGNLFGDQATFHYPQNAAIQRIWNELQSSRLRNFAQQLQDEEAPCLLFTEVPLSEFNPLGDYSFRMKIPSTEVSDEDYRAFFGRVHMAVANLVNSQRDNEASILRKLWDALVLEPNFAGIGIDLKRLTGWK